MEVSTPKQSDAAKSRTITLTLTPTWTACMHILIAAIECGTGEGKRAAKQELFELAARLDRENAGPQDRGPTSESVQAPRRSSPE